MGAWIEISIGDRNSVTIKSHPTMGAWIEIVVFLVSEVMLEMSHPTMGAWIEIAL